MLINTKLAQNLEFIIYFTSNTSYISLLPFEKTKTRPRVLLKAKDNMNDETCSERVNNLSI